MMTDQELIAAKEQLLELDNYQKQLAKESTDIVLSIQETNLKVKEIKVQLANYEQQLAKNAIERTKVKAEYGRLYEAVGVELRRRDNEQREE